MAWFSLQLYLNGRARSEVGDRSFDSAEWKRLGYPDTRLGRVVRESMANDLVLKRSLIGLSWDAAFEILGPPDLELSIRSEEGHLYCYRIGLPGAEDDYFVVDTYPAGIVSGTSFRAVRDGHVGSPD